MVDPLWPLWLLAVFAIAGVVLGFVQMTRARECPYCALPVPRTATTCPHCRSHLRP